MQRSGDSHRSGLSRGGSLKGYILYNLQEILEKMQLICSDWAQISQWLGTRAGDKERRGKELSVRGKMEHSGANVEVLD